MIKQSKIMAAILGCALTSAASADFTVNAVEVGNDVIISGSGSLDLSTWSFIGNDGGANPAINSGVVTVGPSATGLSIYTSPGSLAGPSSITAVSNGASSGSGQTVVFTSLFTWICVPDGYVHGDPLAGDATYLNKSFASMGLVAGDSYTWTWDTATGGQDSYTLNIVVPAPGTAGLLGLAGFATLRRRRRSA